VRANIQLEMTMPPTSSTPALVLGPLAGLVIATACASPWIVNPAEVAAATVAAASGFLHRILGLGWYMAPVVTSLLILLGAVIPNMVAKEDHILRFPNKSGPWPTRAFCALRMLDPVLVAWLLQPATLMTDGKKVLMVGMVAVGALRQAFWITYLNRNEWNWDLAISVALANNWFDWCLMKRLAESEVSSSSNIGRDHLTVLVAVSFFVLGGFLETYSEWQRRKFKDDPRNKGKLYTGGLFAYARHINYLGYILWRTGLGLVSSPPFTLSYSLYHAFDFYARAIPLLQNYMQSKYGDQWTEYTKQTDSVLIPFVL